MESKYNPTNDTYTVTMTGEELSAILHAFTDDYSKEYKEFLKMKKIHDELLKIYVHYNP